MKEMMPGGNTNTVSDVDDSCSIPDLGSFSWFRENEMKKRRKSRLGTHKKQVRVLQDLVINNKDYVSNEKRNAENQIPNKVSLVSSFMDEIEDKIPQVELRIDEYHLSPVAQSFNNVSMVSSLISETDKQVNSISAAAVGDTFDSLKSSSSSTDNLRNEVTPILYSVPKLPNSNTSPFASPQEFNDDMSPVIPPANLIKPLSPPSIIINPSPKPVVRFAEPPPVSLNSSKIPTQLTVKGKSYRVLNLLGTGGSSIVYQVLHPETNESLAVKRVKLSQADEDVANGYLNEVKMLESLQNCDVIIKIYDHEQVYENDKKYLYVVMEKGDVDLSELIRNVNATKKLSIPMIVYYWSEMLLAVNEIHNRGIIHSDLKPANFLLVRGRLKLIDFGIASSMQADMTSVHKDVFCGTLNYMSPEAVNCVQFPSGSAGYKITFKTDVWSLGCILYNLVYGRLPFQHIKKKWDKLKAIVSLNINVEFPDKEDVPPELLNSLKLCLEKDPKKRPSVSELLDRILRMFQGSIIR